MIKFLNNAFKVGFKHNSCFNSSGPIEDLFSGRILAPQKFTSVFYNQFTIVDFESFWKLKII